ncbi:hypothetical protein INR49_000616 [Caranx melampygus]|nr:hypothetical protein INR49_000616 [Caranx melampygus]
MSYTSAIHIAPLSGDAPRRLNTVISTPAGQLWSCGAATHQCNCDTTQQPGASVLSVNECV